MNKRPLSAHFPRYVLLVLIFLGPLLFAACGSEGDNDLLLSDVTADAGQLDLSAGVNQLDALGINYRVGQAARISARLEGPNGLNYPLRQDEDRTPGSYTLRLTGAIDLEENGLSQTRLLPNGEYRYTLTANGSGTSSQASGRFVVSNSPTQAAPDVAGLSANPGVISPDFNAREDTAFLGWRTTRPATITVSIAGANGFNKVLKTSKNQPAQEDKTVFNGLDQRGEPLPDGVYTYTVQAADGWGNISRKNSTVEVKGGGRPSAFIEQATIGPTEIIQGNFITVTMRLRNNGKVPIRSQGPYSGHVYSTNEVFSSIENGKYKDAAGFWRVGVDYESNSGGGASRYPFRWGFKDELQPGQEIEIVGVIRVERSEEKLRFYAGLIQEQIALPQDRVSITLVKISY